MKKFLTLAAVLVSATLFAQQEKDVPAFGKVEKAELELKECDFDKNAEAMVLFDVGELYFDISGGNPTMELVRHIRIKILKDKGLDKADIHIPYQSYRNSEAVKNLSAQTYNLDAAGNIVATKVEKKLIYEKKLNKRFSEEVFSFPEVKAGSVIEYKYILVGAGLSNWYFQRSIPVKYSRYRIDFPEEVEIYSRPLVMLPYESKQEKKRNRDIKTFSMKNVPALRDEPYITCEDDYLQQIESRPVAVKTPMQRISLLRTWPGIIKNLMEDEDFGLQLKKDIPRTTDLDEALKNITDPYRKMAIIHKYVKKNMEWNGYTNIWAQDGVKSAWKDKKGTSGEINLILVNLLKDAGLAAHPILVSTHDNGTLQTIVADASQFNKVLAHVKIGDKEYILDGTDKYTPTHLIPQEVMHTQGLVIEKLATFEWGWRDMWDKTPLFKSITMITAAISNDGILKGEAQVYSYNYSRVDRMPTLKTGKDKFMEAYFTSAHPNIKIDSLTITNEDNDSLSLNQLLQFSQPVSASGDYTYFSVNLFTGLEKNPFVADSRFSDVFFGANQNYQLFANISIPDGYGFEALPKNVRMIMPDTSVSISRFVAVEGNRLTARYVLEFKKPFFTTEEYPDFKEFYKKLFDLLNEQFVIKKK